MSSTNFRSILIFASCVVGTRNILYGLSFYWEESFFLFTIMVSVGIYTLGGEFCYLFRSTLTIKKIMSKARTLENTKYEVGENQTTSSSLHFFCSLHTSSSTTKVGSASPPLLVILHYIIYE